MAHELSIQNGKAEMFSGSGLTPWHKLGTVVQGLATASEALALANLNWNVIPMPVMVNGQTMPFPTDESSKDCFQGITRSDNGKCLGITKGRYECIQNSEAFSFFDSLVGNGKAVYDTAGALRDGKQVWLLAKVDGSIQINGDEHKQYALMLTSHDGSYALQVSWVLTRVVCANTLSIALGGATQTCKIRHTANWTNKEDEARRILGLGENYFTTIQSALQGMNDKLMTTDQMADFSRLLTTVQKPAESYKSWFQRSLDRTTETPIRTENIRSELNRLFCAGQGNNCNSRWDALNAVTDYADHSQSLRGDNSTRLESSLLGSGASLKQRAYDMLTDESLMGSLLTRPHISGNPVSGQSSDFARLMAS